MKVNFSGQATNVLTRHYSNSPKLHVHLSNNHLGNDQVAFTGSSSGKVCKGLAASMLTLLCTACGRPTTDADIAKFIGNNHALHQMVENAKNIKGMYIDFNGICRRVVNESDVPGGFTPKNLETTHSGILESCNIKHNSDGTYTQTIEKEVPQGLEMKMAPINIRNGKPGISFYPGEKMVPATVTTTYGDIKSILEFKNFSGENVADFSVVPGKQLSQSITVHQ